MFKGFKATRVGTLIRRKSKDAVSEDSREEDSSLKSFGEVSLADDMQTEGDEDGAEWDVNARLQTDEIAFLCKSVRRYVREYADDYDPKVFHREGAVLFVDISGFSKLSKMMLDKYAATTAAENFARDSIVILNLWTKWCMQWGGDVVKFAGDALLVMWVVPTNEEAMSTPMYKGSDAHIKNLKDCQRIANRAALDLLKRTSESFGDLNLHGGVAIGEILEIFLSAPDGSSRWHLVSGQAMKHATDLVDHASTSEVASAKGADFAENGQFWTITPEMVADDNPDIFMQDKVSRPLSFMPVRGKWESFYLPKGENEDDNSSSGTRESGMENAFAVVAKLAAQAAHQRRPGALPAAAVRSFIPKLLRGKLGSGNRGAEMRWCAVMFVSLPNVKLDSGKNMNNDLKKFNDTFLRVSRIVHKANGEIRDLLFDDKGCVFIAVFGAYRQIGSPELGTLRAAKSIRRSDSSVSIGVSAGICYAGLCGTYRRHDFVVMGHSVNSAARFMGAAGRGEIVVGDDIRNAGQEYYKFKERTVEKKKATYTEVYKAYVLGSKLSALRRRSTLNMGKGKEKMYGRSIEQGLIKIYLEDVIGKDATGLLTLEGDRGIGKTTMVRWIRKELPWQTLYAYGDTMESETDFFVFRQLFERGLNISEHASDAELKLKLDLAEKQLGLNRETLGAIIPYIAELNEFGERSKDKLHRASSVASFSSIDVNKSPEELEMLRDKLADAFVKMLRGMDTQTTAWIVIVEDANFFDSMSLDLLLELLRLQEQLHAVVFVLTLKEDESEGGLKFTTVLDDMKKIVGKITRIQLQTLSRQESDALVHRTIHKLGAKYGLMVGRVPLSQLEVDAKVLDLVYRKTSGVPGSIVEKVDLLLSRRYLKDDQKNAKVIFSSESRAEQAELESPTSFHEILLEKFDKLSEIDKAVLKVAALIGMQFSPKLIVETIQSERREDGLTVTDDTILQHLLHLQSEKFVMRIIEEGKGTLRKTRAKNRRADSVHDSLELEWEFDSTAVMNGILELMPLSRRTFLKDRIDTIRMNMAYSPLKGIQDAGLV